MRGAEKLPHFICGLSEEEGEGAGVEESGMRDSHKFEITSTQPDNARLRRSFFESLGIFPTAAAADVNSPPPAGLILSSSSSAALFDRG